MNFVFISPNYPECYWLFCRGLKKYGAKVLAIVDSPHDSLSKELKENIDDCYYVSSFHDYDQVFKAVAYFSYKYGKIDWIESNNEAWLTLDARLRDDFNVRSGFSLHTIEEYQSKAAMKKYYALANIPTARYCLYSSFEEASFFGETVGYPLVLKPDHGVGASCTYILQDKKDLEIYYEKTKDQQMILEEYIDGDVFTLDGICDQHGEIRYLSSMEYVGNCMDSVLNQESIGAYTTFEIPFEERKMIQDVIHAFELKNRFFHCEFFRLIKDKEGVGQAGEIFGLEVNFRPPGGFAPDLMNYAGSIDVYDIWAEILLKQNTYYPRRPRKSCAFAGRRQGIAYQYSLDEIQQQFHDELKEVRSLPKALAQAMGDVTITCLFTEEIRRKEFFDIVFSVQKEG